MLLFANLFSYLGTRLKPLVPGSNSETGFPEM